MCEKRIVVFHAGSGAVNPTLPLLGFQKITSKGSYVIYCADGYNPKDYPEGWLYEVDENGNKIAGTDNPDAHDPEEGNLGLFPFGFSLLSLPSWLWMLVVLGVVFYISSGSDD